MTGPRIVASSVVVDCDDPNRLAQFWQLLLGGDTIDWRPKYNVMSLQAPGITLDFVHVPDTKSVKNRLHIDLASDDPVAAVQRARELGATAADDICVSDSFTVLRDPEGNEFCVLHHANPTAPWAAPD